MFTPTPPADPADGKKAGDPPKAIDTAPVKAGEEKKAAEPPKTAPDPKATAAEPAKTGEEKKAAEPPKAAPDPKVVYTAQQYTRGCMHKRNRHLVNYSGVCVCYLTKDSGGTAYTVQYAKGEGLEIINIAQNEEP